MTEAVSGLVMTGRLVNASLIVRLAVTILPRLVPLPPVPSCTSLNVSVSVRKPPLFRPRSVINTGMSLGVTSPAGQLSVPLAVV